MSDMKPRSQARKLREEKQAEYWQKREKKALEAYAKDEKEYLRHIEQIYQNMLYACQKEIDAFYGKYAAKEGISIAEAKKRVSELDIKAYERKAKKYVEERDFSKQANEEMRLYNLTMKVNRLEMLKANIGLELISGYDELEKYLAEILQGRTMEELERQAGILGETILDNAQKAENIVNASFYHATFSERIWGNQAALKSSLANLLQSGLIQGKNPRVLARELQKTFGAQKYQAERLAITELARVQIAAQKASFERNHFTQYTFLCNSGACASCKERNGKHYDVAKMMPGLNAPPLHPLCRCSTAAYEDSAEYEKWLDFLERGGTTEEWENLKNAKARYKDNESVFQTLDARGGKGRDVIKPRNIMKEMKKSQIGTELLAYIQENDIRVNIWYGVDVDKNLAGVFDEGEINIYADNTKNVRETAITVIHEATHAKINKPNTKNQELECYMNEYRHQNIDLTEEVIQGIIKHIDDKYTRLEWE